MDSEAKKVLDEVIAAVTAKKAECILVLDLREYASITDYFLICNGTSHRHVSAIVDSVLETMHGNQYKVHHVEGQSLLEWVLIDCSDIVIHIFHQDRRQFYQLENLWRDATVYYDSQKMQPFFQE